MDCGFLWHLFQLRSFGSEKEIRPLQSMQRSDAAYENRTASLQQIPRCQSGTTGKQRGEYHTPGQKLLVVFLKVKKNVHTHFCLQTCVLRCLALKSSGESIGFKLEHFACIIVVRSGPGSKTNQTPSIITRQLKLPLRTIACTVLGRREEYCTTKIFPSRTPLTAAKNHEAYQHLSVVFQVSCPPCFQQLCTDQSGRTSHRSLMRS